MKLEQIDADKFNRQIDIYAQPKVKDTAGGFDYSNAEYIASMWVKVESWKGWNVVQDITNRDASTILLKFTCHWDSGITVDMMVKYNGNWLQVREVENIDGADWFMVLKCEGLKS